MDIADDRNVSLVLSVCEQVAAEENASPCELPPLGTVIDPTVIELLPEDATLTFAYCGYEVVVRGEGAVTVRDPPDEDP